MTSQLSLSLYPALSKIDQREQLVISVYVRARQRSSNVWLAIWERERPGGVGGKRDHVRERERERERESKVRVHECSQGKKKGGENLRNETADWPRSNSPHYAIDII